MEAQEQARRLAPTTPTIKGVFVNSHLKAIEKLHGKEGIARLETMVGRSLRFANGQDVPVALEVQIIEAAVEFLVDEPVPEGQVAYEAGRLHFRNFSMTPWARLIFRLFPRNFRFMMMHAPTIAERVFQGVTFRSESIGPCCIKIVMGNADYPIDHFRGLFQEWMDAYETGHVVAQEIEPRTFAYVLTWGADAA